MAVASASLAKRTLTVGERFGFPKVLQIFANSKPPLEPPPKTTTKRNSSTLLYIPSALQDMASSDHGSEQSLCVGESKRPRSDSSSSQDTIASSSAHGSLTDSTHGVGSLTVSAPAHPSLHDKSEGGSPIARSRSVSPRFVEGGMTGDSRVSRSLRPYLSAYRCDRVGICTWIVHDVKLYDIDAFLRQGDLHCVYAVKNPVFTAEERKSKRCFCKNDGFVSLEKELLRREAVVTTWPSAEFPQLKEYMDSCLALHNTMCHLLVPSPLGVFPEQKNAETIPATGPATSLTRKKQQMQVNCSGCDELSLSAHGSEAGTVMEEGGVHFLYERVVQMGFCIRGTDNFKAPQCWREVFPMDIGTLVDQCSSEVAGSDVSFDRFLGKLFPQLRSTMKKVQGGLDNIVVSYRALDSNPLRGKRDPSAAMDAGEEFQCIGTLQSTVSDILSRYDTLFERCIAW